MQNFGQLNHITLALKKKSECAIDFIDLSLVAGLNETVTDVNT